MIKESELIVAQAMGMLYCSKCQQAYCADLTECPECGCEDIIPVPPHSLKELGKAMDELDSEEKGGDKIMTGQELLAQAIDEMLQVEYQEQETKAATKHENNRYEIMNCMRRVISKGLLDADQIHAAFGAPGDWGYGTPIGDALLKIYQGK